MESVIESNVVDVSQLSVEELQALAAKKASQEQEVRNAEVQDKITELEIDLASAKADVETAKESRDELIKTAKESGKALVKAAKEKVSEIQNRIDELSGKAIKATGTRTKSEGFGKRDRDQTVLATLGEFDGPATPKQVVARILENGLFIGKEQSLTVSVSNALNALATKGDAEKIGNKRGVTFQVA